MSNENLDTRFFGERFQAENPQFTHVVKDVGALLDKYGVERLEDLPPEVQDSFYAELATMSWSIPNMEAESE